MLHGQTHLRTAFLCVAIVSGCSGPVDILPETLPNGVEGQSYSQTLAASGLDPVTWSISSGSLPAGLSLEETSGLISGTPTQAGSFDFTVAVTGGVFPARQGEATYSLTIIDRLTVDATLDAARVGEAYSHRFTVSGGVQPYQYELIGLPGGLSFDDQTATISGTPNVARSNIQLQLTVTDSGDPQQAVVKSMLFTVKPPPVQITTTTLAQGQVNVPYTDRLAVADDTGTAPYTWAVVAGVLPQGLRLNLTTGEISGTPGVVQTERFTVQVTDGDSPPTTDSQELTIEIEE